MSDQRPKGPTDRLPSLKGKRDLTLGGVKKKVYVPNIPARRPKPEAPPKAPEATPTIKPVPSSKSKKAPPLEKGRGKRRREIVTSASVFSMGPAEGARGRGGGGGATFGSIKRDTVVKEERKLKPIKREIERDYESSGEEGEDCLHRPAIASVFSSCPLPPVQLPLKHFTRTNKEKPLTLNKQIKEEPMDTDMVLVKPVHPVSETSQTSPSEIFQPTEECKGQFLLFQLPDCLPLPSPPSPDESSSIVTGSLRDIPDGLMGRLSVHKSGRVNIGLGDVSLSVTMGTRGGFLQELASLKSTAGEGSFITLGHLSHKLNCTPDLESLGLYTER